MAANFAVGLLFKLPLVVLTSGLGITSFSHVVFGVVGGVVASLLIKRLKPQLSNWE